LGTSLRATNHNRGKTSFLICWAVASFPR